VSLELHGDAVYINIIPPLLITIVVIITKLIIVAGCRTRNLQRCIFEI
jgi:hypothetical protein